MSGNDIVACIDIDGTVIDRLFINQSKEKDQLKHKLNKLAKAKRKSGMLNEKHTMPTYRLHIILPVDILQEQF